MYLFDASSIVNLVKRGIVKIFANGFTIDLAHYESLNAVWKEYMLLKNIDRKTALDFISLLADVINVLSIIKLKGFEKEVFDLAIKEELTIYDASYLYASIIKNLILVTDDERFKVKASKYVNVVSSSKLINI